MAASRNLLCSDWLNWNLLHCCVWRSLKDFLHKNWNQKQNLGVLDNLIWVPMLGGFKWQCIMSVAAHLSVIHSYSEYWCITVCSCWASIDFRSFVVLVIQFCVPFSRYHLITLRNHLYIMVGKSVQQVREYSCLKIDAECFDGTNSWCKKVAVKHSDACCIMQILQIVIIIHASVFIMLLECSINVFWSTAGFWCCCLYNFFRTF